MKAADIQAAVADCIKARAAAIDADDQLASLTLVVQLANGRIRAVLYRTESRVGSIKQGMRLPKV